MGIRANFLKEQRHQPVSGTKCVSLEQSAASESKPSKQLATVHQIGSRTNRDCYESIAAPKAEGHRDVIGELCERIISQVMNVPLSGLRSRSRNIAEIAFARQMAMYLMNTKAGYPPTEVSIYFHRHISTVIHAFGLIEDKRDDPEFDMKLTAIEDILEEIDDVNQFLAQMRSNRKGQSLPCPAKSLAYGENTK